MTVELYGYRYSVYSWIARLALEEKGGDYHWIEVNPFAPDVPESYLALHPSNACRHSFTTTFRSTRPARSRATSTRHSLVLVSSPRTRAIAPAAASSSPSLIATFTGHWCVKYFRIASFDLSSGGHRISQRFKGVWRQRLRFLPHWSGLLLTRSVSAVPTYLWPTSILRRWSDTSRRCSASSAIGGRRCQRGSRIAPPSRGCLRNWTRPCGPDYADTARQRCAPDHGNAG
jgi:hypothetical protein